MLSLLHYHQMQLQKFLNCFFPPKYERHLYGKLKISACKQTSPGLHDRIEMEKWSFQSQPLWSWFRHCWRTNLRKTNISRWIIPQRKGCHLCTHLPCMSVRELIYIFIIFLVKGGLLSAVWSPLRYIAADPGVGILQPTGRVPPSTELFTGIQHPLDPQMLADELSLGN